MAIAERKLGGILAASFLLATTFAAVSASAESKARIVRLSEVEGTVKIDRTAGDGFDKAFINLPVIEGAKLKTGSDGRAEVEFEDGSALRLAPNTEVAFTTLSLGDDGQKLSTVQLVSGTIYANVHPKSAYGKEKSGDRFQLNFAQESIAVPDPAHFRVELEGHDKATIAVFKGEVNATAPGGEVEVAEKHSATINLTKNDSAENKSAQNHAGKDDAEKNEAFVVARNFETEPSDAWDHQQSDYHDRYATASKGSGIASPYAYGMSDLNYYGNFMSLPGYGNVWQPFFTGANWSPFQDGGWAFYPGSGYTFVSGYPWGWMPYRYGTWAFAPAFGWVWQPGFANSWNALPVATNVPARMKMPTPPALGRQTVMVGLGMAANPAFGSSHHLTINPNSAGFGVPRGSINHLDHIARTVDKTSRPVVVSTAPPAQPSMSQGGFGGPSTTSTGMMGGSHHAAGATARSH